MASTRLPGCDVASTIQRIAENVQKNERAELALTRASSIVKTKGLSAPVIERVIASNPQTTGYSLKILEAGLCGEDGAKFESVRQATDQVGINIVWRAAEAAGGDCGLDAPPGDLSQAVLDGALLKPENRDELLEIATGALGRAESVGNFDLPEAA